MYNRYVQLQEIARKSIFLLGPRQTGKSTLLKQQLPKSPYYNLLDSNTFRKLSADPGLLRRELEGNTRPKDFVIIDEIQLLPELLNEVHLLIEQQKLRFILTGSSARTLRRRGTNLLGGRASLKYLHPLVYTELNQDYDLKRAINYGLLPSIYLSDQPETELGDYVGLYLKEEIAAEGLTRNLPSFSRFLEVAALSNGSIINLTKIASDAEIKRTTVNDWFQVLRDTLIAWDLPAWTKSKKRKAINSAKMYFFDIGVARFLTGQKTIERNNPWFGIALETLLFHELRSFVDYGNAETLEYWRSTSGFEVDFILDRKIAIEVKASTKVNKEDLKGLLAIHEEQKDWKKVLVYLGDKKQKWEGIDILPYEDFLKVLWNKARE